VEISTKDLYHSFQLYRKHLHIIAPVKRAQQKYTSGELQGTLGNSPACMASEEGSSVKRRSSHASPNIQRRAPAPGSRNIERDAFFVSPLHRSFTS
jgi:hypothetical protein